MSAEEELRDALETLFDPYDWHDDDGNALAPDQEAARSVLDVLKSRELLITDGKIMRVEHAGLGASGRWLVRVAES